MFSHFARSARPTYTALVLTRSEVVLGAEDFHFHLLTRELHHEDLDAENAREEAEQLQAEWNSLSPARRQAFVEDYAERWYSNSPLVGEYRFDTFCHQLMQQGAH